MRGVSLDRIGSNSQRGNRAENQRGIDPAILAVEPMTVEVDSS